MQSEVKISVVIVSYNFEKYLRECIESVLAQTMIPYEIIICDDASTDTSWNIISEYVQKYPTRIQAYRQEKNLGQPHNGDFGRQKATGNLITWLDGDDRWLPKKLELEWKALQEHPEARIAYSNVYTIDAKGNRTGVWYDGRGNIPPSGDVFVQTYSRNYFPNCSSVFRNFLIYRSALEENGYHDDDENLKSYWDWDLKIRLTARFLVAYSGEPLVEYRLHEGGYSKYQPSMQFGALAKVYEKHLPLLAFRSKMEAAIVLCNVENLLMMQQSSLPASQRIAKYSASSVYERCCRVLSQLTKHEINIMEEKLSTSLVCLARQAISEQIEKGNRILAAIYGAKYLRLGLKYIDLKLFCRILLPSRAYELLRSSSHRFRNLVN
jgi:glycosyltransferase involved in cell wall biosynthesis